MKETSPREIARAVERGVIPPEEAERLFRQLHGREGEIIAYGSHPNRFNAIVRVKDYVFDHQRAFDHYLDRKDFEEGIKHMVGYVFFGASGIIDGASEGVIYLATELAENLSYFTARTIRRLGEGWQRGMKG